MLAFLGIVADEDVKRGIIEPSYYLTENDTPDETDVRHYMIASLGSRFENTPKVLLTSFTGNEDYIAFMSNKKLFDVSVDKETNKEKTKILFVEGILCYFPCDIYGERVNEPAVYIKRVPDRNAANEYGKLGGLTQMNTLRSAQRDPFVALVTDKDYYDIAESNVKCKVPQSKQLYRRKTYERK